MRVALTSGEDIAHLGELDQKMWTVLSCPVKGLNFDARTLEILDADKDGVIRVPEVVAAAQWLTSIIKDRDLILKGEDTLPLDQFNTENPVAAKLHKSAKQILGNLGLKDSNCISLAQSSDSTGIFHGTPFNGDGVVTEDSTQDEGLKEVINAAIATVGGVTDRGGKSGVDAATIEKFYAACADYAAWQQTAKQNSSACFPFGEKSAEAFAACEAIKEKIEDFFMRCHLIGYSGKSAEVLGVDIDRIKEVGQGDVAKNIEKIALYPLANPVKDCILRFDAINPAWAGAFAAFKTNVLDLEFPAAESLSEADWKAVYSKAAGYGAWKAAAKGLEVEGLGLEKIETLIKGNGKQEILDLISKDLELKEESESIDEVDKLLHLYKYFCKFLRNYVIFSDLYDRKEHAVFEAGKLFIEQRCCTLCIKVEDMSKHADIASLSGMFLIYCTCTSRVKGQTMNIVAVMTDGSVTGLRPGKNAIFYDCDGQDWDAVVTKIVDNPISIRQAFLSPYRKLGDFITKKIESSAAEKESKSTTGLLSAADKATSSVGTGEAPKAVKPPFDIAKFAGIFAAIGMAFGYIGALLKDIVSGATAAPGKALIVLVAILLVISLPSCFLAWLKLRKRNLGPVLNANGWAINSVVLVNAIFGGTLTSVAKYPVIKIKKSTLKKLTAGIKLEEISASEGGKKKKGFRIVLVVLLVLLAAGAALYFTGVITF